MKGERKPFFLQNSRENSSWKLLTSYKSQASAQKPLSKETKKTMSLLQLLLARGRRPHMYPLPCTPAILIYSYVKGPPHGWGSLVWNIQGKYIFFLGVLARENISGRSHKETKKICQNKQGAALLSFPFFVKSVNDNDIMFQKYSLTFVYDPRTRDFFVPQASKCIMKFKGQALKIFLG